ncbi:patatin-like phospholipase family protein [Micromonospora sp. BRA006-A]|nr:patatin-like phospholipase family protein [Micromonospora sp. BRA006-A]
MGRALVLGGGGVTGVAWELGLLAGLAGHGLRFDEADLVVGTSAGSVVGAQVRSGTPPAQLYEAQLRPPARRCRRGSGRACCCAGRGPVGGAGTRRGPGHVSARWRCRRVPRRSSRGGR